MVWGWGLILGFWGLGFQLMAVWGLWCGAFLVFRLGLSPRGALAQNHPPGSTKFPRFRGLFLSLSTPECFLEKGYYLGSCWSGKGTKSVSNRYKSGKGIVLSGTEC